ncbi:MAG: hypothetical protein ABSB30_14105 [Terracidiphilus sp.]|jgi:hypothetical protein
MTRAGRKNVACLLGVLLCACSLLPAQKPEQAPAQLNVSGQIVVDGHSIPYLIRHLPVSSFPELPAELVTLLNRRGCLIPQTYEAHRPENVIHASLERHGSSDWAVLCSAQGTVSLLVFFSSSPDKLLVLSAAPETERLQAHDPSGVLGFNWGIDPASPEQVRQAQAGLLHRPAPVDHDALADSLVDQHTIYHFYLNSAWIVLEMPD